MTMTAVTDEIKTEKAVAAKPSGKTLWLLAPGVLWMLLFLVLPLAIGKQFLKAVVPALKRIEQHASLRLFSDAQRFEVVSTRDQQSDEAHPGGEFVLEEALLLLSSPGNFVADRLDGRDGF